MRQTHLVLLIAGLLLAVGCDEKKKDEAASPAASAPAASPASAAASNATANPNASVAVAGGSAAPTAIPGVVADEPVPAGATRFALTMGKGTFLIDAPLEKIKGSSDELRGRVDVDPKDVSKTRGEIAVRLSTLRTHTFTDDDKNVAQTEHARNWMEVGNDASPQSRMKYEWATFKITSVDATGPAAGSVKAKVNGDLTVHGVTSKKTVPVTVTFKGPADAPTELSIKTDEAMGVSLKEHGIMPRDKVGGFLNGALERIGKKIDDKVQVSFDAVAKATMPPHP